MTNLEKSMKGVVEKLSTRSGITPHVVAYVSMILAWIAPIIPVYCLCPLTLYVLAGVLSSSSTSSEANSPVEIPYSTQRQVKHSDHKAKSGCCDRECASSNQQDVWCTWAAASRASPARRRRREQSKCHWMVACCILERFVSFKTPLCSRQSASLVWYWEALTVR